jgi:hypothetical protein
VNIEWKQGNKTLKQALYAPSVKARLERLRRLFYSFQSSPALKAELLRRGDVEGAWELSMYDIEATVTPGTAVQPGNLVMYVKNLGISKNGVEILESGTEPTQVTMNDTNCEAHPLPDMADNPYNGIQLSLRWECDQIPNIVFWLPVFAKCPNGKMDQLEKQLGHLSHANNTFLKTLFRMYIEDFTVLKDTDPLKMILRTNNRTTDQREQDVPDNTYIFYVGTFSTTRR